MNLIPQRKLAPERRLVVGPPGQGYTSRATLSDHPRCALWPQVAFFMSLIRSSFSSSSIIQREREEKEKTRERKCPSQVRARPRCFTLSANRIIHWGHPFELYLFYSPSRRGFRLFSPILTRPQNIWPYTGGRERDPNPTVSTRLLSSPRPCRAHKSAITAPDTPWIILSPTLTR